ncbi:MAG: LuxR C-terminal-related transcriptional regulator [Balneolaceae bacterium]
MGNSNENQPTNGKTYTKALEILTPREVEILKLTEKGYLNRETAHELGLSIRTVQTHRSNICKKLGLKGRSALIKWLWEQRNGEK